MTVFGIWDYVMYLPANPKGGQERLRRRAEHAPIPERFPDRIERSPSGSDGRAAGFRSFCLRYRTEPHGRFDPKCEQRTSQRTVTSCWAIRRSATSHTSSSRSRARICRRATPLLARGGIVWSESRHHRRGLGRRGSASHLERAQPTIASVNHVPQSVRSCSRGAGRSGHPRWPSLASIRPASVRVWSRVSGGGPSSIPFPLVGVSWP